jgi:hypothetical protein
MKPMIDDLLKEWGEHFYYPSSHTRQGRNIRGGCVFSSPSSPIRNPTLLRQKFAMTVNKAPEVMVKITGGGKNMQHIKAHFDYISRQGELSLEDENGELYHGQDEVKVASHLWAKGKMPIPLTGEKRREAINLVLSMPEHTDRGGVEQASREFAADQFKHHQYVFAAHHDEAHPHVHLLIKMTDKFGVRLNPRKRDLQQWREHFAAKLREQGIAANATPCLARGIVRQSKKYATHVIEQRENKPPQSAKKSLQQKKTPLFQGDSFHFKENQNAILLLYAKTAKELANSSKTEDKQLALEVIKFIHAMPQFQVLHKTTAHTQYLKMEIDKQK